MTGSALETFLFEKIQEYCSVTQFYPQGSFYKKGMRHIADPKSYNTEDVVVSTITGNGKELQKGTCVINVYVPDVQVNSGRWLENKVRCGEIEEWLEGAPAFFRSGELYFTKAGMIVTLEEKELHEHFVSLKMDFKTIQDY